MKLTAETLIHSPLEQVWRRSQTPELHVRWDLRFTEISYLTKESPDTPQRFRYSTRIGMGASVEGWGETIKDTAGIGSVLSFGSEDPKALIREGKGFWQYREEPGVVRFRTAYHYRTRWGWAGRLIDQLAFRPMMIWATRWSFDRLRLWMERELAPEVAFRLWGLKLILRILLAAVWVFEGLLPKILFVSASEIELVRRSGVFWPTPEATLAILGFLEIAVGVLLLIGAAERIGALVSSIAIIILSGLALAFEPTALADPLGGIIKNLGLVGCALAVWVLEPITPKASRARGKNRSTPEARQPFSAALGETANSLAPGVRRHFLMPEGRRFYRGVMHRIWRRSGWRGWLASPFLWLGGKMETLFAETGTRIPFELENVVRRDQDGRVIMTWGRIFHFPGAERRFSATMHFDSGRGVLTDRLGRFRHLEVELHPAVVQSTLELRSGRQCFLIGPVRLPLPRWFTGEAHVREWQENEHEFGIRVVIRNPLLGDFFGYEGSFQESV